MTETISTGAAPMEGVTIFPTRLWLASVSQPAHMTTPFLRSTRALLTERKLPASFIPELTELKDAFPYQITPQLMAGEDEPFLHVADLLRAAGAQTIELNCGCPSPAAVGRYAGSGILRDPEHFAATMARFAAALDARHFAVKMRLGFAKDEEFSDLLPAVSNLALARLTVHGRTRADGYRGHARWEAIEKAAHTAIAPTWASGDVFSYADLTRLQGTAPSIEGVIIGRGLISNPWIFEEIRQKSAINLDVTTLAHALVCFALLHQLWISAPKTLLGRVANGRIDFDCGTNPERWERQTAQLASLVFGFPCVLSATRPVPSLELSATAFERLRYLWNSLRFWLPEAFHTPKLMRIKRLDEFIQSLFNIHKQSLDPQAMLTLRAHTTEAEEPT